MRTIASAIKILPHPEERALRARLEGRTVFMPLPSACGGLELDLHEDEFVVAAVHDVVLDADGPVVGAAGDQLGPMRLLAVLDHQMAAGDGHHALVVSAAMPAGFDAHGEAPPRHPPASASHSHRPP